MERKIKARDERKERERRQWTRDRDRANERSGRYDSGRDGYSSRNDDRDRPYSEDTTTVIGRIPVDLMTATGLVLAHTTTAIGPRSRGDYRDDRDDRYKKDDYLSDRPRSRVDSRRESDYDRPRSPPAPRSAPPPPAALASPVSRDPPLAPSPSVPQSTSSPALKNMSHAERAAFVRAEGQRRIQARMAALGVDHPRLADPRHDCGRQAEAGEKGGRRED